MPTDQLLNILGTLILLISGVATLVAPNVFARLVSFTVAERGRAEIRVNFGGFWTGLGIGALLLNHPDVYTALGAAWIGVVLARLLAYLLDRPRLDASYVLLLVGEIVTALLLLA